MTKLAAEDFESLFRYYQRSAFRLETQPQYKVEAEQENVEAFLAGQPTDPSAVPYFAAWLAQIREVTAQGRRVQRVRITDDPPTDYQRWERWVGKWNSEAGEIIGYLERGAAAAAGLPVDYDWWLFDDRALAVMRFSDDGTPLGGEIVTDEETVIQHCAWRDLAVRLAAH